MNEIINNLDNYDLIKIAMEINNDIIPEDALIDKLHQRYIIKNQKQ